MGVVKNGFVVGVFAGLALTGCQNKLQQENKALWSQTRQQQEKIDEMNTAPKADAAQLAALQTEIAQRDAKIAELQSQLREPAAGQTADPGIAGIETTFNKATGDMTVNIPGDVLFDAGRATLKDSSRSTLGKITSAIRADYAGKRVLVCGHTDSDPITKTKGMWQDNLDLSAARARAVANYLISQGLDVKLVETQAFGATMPKKTKDASRRVEIVVATR